MGLRLEHIDGNDYVARTGDLELWLERSGSDITVGEWVLNGVTVAGEPMVVSIIADGTEFHEWLEHQEHTLRRTASAP